MASRGACAYCPSCSCTVRRETTELSLLVLSAQHHARITGHPVNLVDVGTWSVLETVSGEPSLPLWE